MRWGVVAGGGGWWAIGGGQTFRRLSHQTAVGFSVISADRLLLCKYLRLRREEEEEEEAAVEAAPFQATPLHNDSHYLTEIEPGEGHLELVSQLANSRAAVLRSLVLVPVPELGRMDGETFGGCFRGPVLLYLI